VVAAVVGPAFGDAVERGRAAPLDAALAEAVCVE
jgi:hypothetical protein